MSWLAAVRARYLVSADPLRTQRRLELVALILAALLCLQLAYGGVRLATLGAPAKVEPAADSMRVVALPALAEVTEEARYEIISRPLFWPGRRPVDEVAVIQDTRPPEREQSELRDLKQVGVFGSGEEAGIIALVNGKKRRILLGETVDGWTLESIGATDSEFANGVRRATLTLQRGTVTAAPARTERAKPGKDGSGKKSRAGAPAGVAAVPEAPAGTANPADPAPQGVRDTDDSLSLGGGSSRR